MAASSLYFWPGSTSLAFSALLVGLSSLPGVFSDLPVHCLRHQLVGDWDFFLGPASSERSSCGHQSPDVPESQPAVFLAEVSQQRKVQLQAPSRARSGADDQGSWTMIYDEAFEVNVDSLSFLAFSRFDLVHNGTVTTNVSQCGETQLGWYRNVDRDQWGCFYARKSAPIQEHESTASFSQSPVSRSASYDEPLVEEYHQLFAASLNLLQDMWTAKSYERLVNRTLRDINKMAGILRPFSAAEHGKSDLIAASSRPVARSPSFLQQKSTEARSTASFRGASSSLPSAWDWRNVSGISYLDKVMDQAGCGSCYVVATTHMLSARHRIKQQDPSFDGFSINFPLHCSEYNQGCDGGYAFLASRWAQDVGLVPKHCSTYSPVVPSCQLACDVTALEKRWRADNHHYVGGHYGGATEEKMLQELVDRGPLVVSFEPKHEFMYYDGGIYSTVPNQRREWEQVDHAVLLVGFGQQHGKKYWLLQNSWGEDWGEQGFFRMVRGSDESGIESIVVGADVVEDSQPSVLLQFAKSA